MEQLEKYFDTAFDAPDGVKKVKELILSLAFQGKFNKRTKKHQIASDLLENIEIEKRNLIKTGKIKVKKDLNRDNTKNVSDELPNGWSWVSLREISYDLGQKTPSSNFTYIDVGSVDNINGRISEAVQILDSKEAPSRARKIVREGTIIYSTVRPYLLNIAIVEKVYKPEPIASTAFAILHPFSGINNRYVYFYLRSPKFLKHVENLMKGVAYPAINDGDFFKALIPLPPTIEQNEIVAKIDQLMSRCDELEKLRAKRHQKRVDIHTAAIRKLLDAPDQETFDEAWHFIIRNFKELYSVKENVAELKKAILQLAVMGKLVPQDPKEGTARELLEEIEREKRKMVKGGKMKESKPSSQIIQQDSPYEIPKSWILATLDSISLKSDSGWSPQCLATQRKGNDWGVLKVSAVSWGLYNPDENKALPKSETPRPDCEVKKGDFLISRANTDELVARSVILHDTPDKLMMSDKIVRFKLSTLVNKDYINICNNSSISREYYIMNASGTSSSMKNVSRNVMRNLVIPLSPKEEQDRIVSKTNQLLSLCSSLESQIDWASKKQGELLRVVYTDEVQIKDVF